jgi:hypothetical protein
LAEIQSERESTRVRQEASRNRKIGVVTPLSQDVTPLSQSVTPKGKETKLKETKGELKREGVERIPLYRGCEIFRATEDQVDALRAEYPDTDEYIRYMEVSMKAKGLTYKNYPAAFRTWKKMDERRGIQPVVVSADPPTIYSQLTPEQKTEWNKKHEQIAMEGGNEIGDKKQGAAQSLIPE